MRSSHAPVPIDSLGNEDETTAATRFGASPARVDPPDAHGPASPYAAIEQLEPGLPQGPWTDDHGLAAVLYACVTGDPPPPTPNRRKDAAQPALQGGDWRSEGHKSELQSLIRNSYTVFCVKKK